MRGAAAIVLLLARSTWAQGTTSPPAPPVDETTGAAEPVAAPPATAAGPQEDGNALGPLLAKAEAPGFSGGPLGPTAVSDAPRSQVALGPLGGVGYRSSRSASVDYGWGGFVGGEARVQGLPRLSFHLAVTYGWQPAALSTGALGPEPSTKLRQPTLALTSFHLYAAPHLDLHDRWRLSGGLGGGWSFVDGPSPESPRSAPERYVGARRTGSFYEFEAMGALRFVAVERWLELSVTGLVALPVYHRGGLFEGNMQLFDEADPSAGIAHVEPLPGFGPSGSASLTISFLL